MKLDLQFVIKNGESLFNLLRWGKMPICPYCGSSHVYKGKGRYKCGNCGHRFTSKTATLFHSSNLSITTIITGIYLMMSNRGISSYILGEQLGITQKAAWSLQTRLRYVLIQHDIQGTAIMADEAYIGGRVSNMHRAKKYQLAKLYDIPLSDDGKMCHSAARAIANAHTKHVMGITDTDGQVLLQYCPSGFARGAALRVIYDHAPNANHITTDESALYQLLPDDQHSIVNHSMHIYKSDDGHSTNSCENMFGWFKGQSDHNHRHYKRKYTQGYLNEFAFRRNHHSVWDRMVAAFEFIILGRLTIKEITA